MNHKSQEKIPQIYWIGKINTERPDLGLPVLQNIEAVCLCNASPVTGMFNHHSYIIEHNDILYAAWSNHPVSEDAPGQRVLASYSTDKGKTWSAAKELFPPIDKTADREEQRDDSRILIPNGFAVVGQRLYAVAEAHVYLFGPRPVPVFRRPGLGRLCREIMPDGGAGPIFWLTGNPPEPVPGFPAFVPASDKECSDLVPKINEFLAQPEHLPSWEFVNQTCRVEAADGRSLCEPTQAWRLPDGTLVRMYRSFGEYPVYNYFQFSSDGGMSFSAAMKSNFPDASSRSAAGNLPDGTAYVVNNPGKTRDPLVISLAKDGRNFNHHAVIAMEASAMRYEGHAKLPGYQYPRTVFFDDNLYVMYSVNKEDICVSTIPLKALSLLMHY